MSRTAPGAVLRSQFEAYVRGDLDAFVEHWATDCTFRDMTEPGPREGHDELREYMARNLRDLTDMRTRIATLVGSGEHAVAEIEIVGTWRGDGAGPGGTAVTLNFCVVDVVRDGLVHSETVYWDSNQLAEQLSRKRQTIEAGSATSVDAGG